MHDLVNQSDADTGSPQKQNTLFVAVSSAESG